MKRLVYVIVASVLAVSSLLAACASPAATPTQATTAPTTTAPKPTVTATATPTATVTPKYGGQLKITYATGPGTSIGMPMEAVGGTVATEQLSLETLFREDIDGSLNPWLATSMDVAQDGSSITIHLRKGVKFQDGTDFNAQAVKWNWDQVKAIGMNNNVSDYWKSVDVIDDYTFKVTYTVWQNVALKSLGENWTYIVSPTAYQKNGLDWMRQNMVGTGPFKQVSYQRDVQFTGAKFDGYWQPGKPYLDGVQLLYVSDELTRIALLKSGGTDVLIGVPDKAHADLQTQGYYFLHQPTGVLSLVPDSGNADSPWSNLKVRQAAEYAIDKDSLTKALGYGLMTSAYQLPTTTSTVYDKNFTGAKTYDAAKATQLMADAGYANGFKTRIIVAPGGNSDIALAIQNYWGKIGIQATIETPTTSANQLYLTNGWQNGVLQMGIGQWPNYNSVWGFYFTKNSNWFPVVTKSDKLQQLITTSYASLKPEVPLEQAVLNNIYGDELVIPVYHSQSIYVMQNYVKDTGWLTRMFSIYWRPDNVWISK